MLQPGPIVGGHPHVGVQIESVQVDLARPSGEAGGLDRLSAQAPDPGSFDLGACSSLPTAPRALAGPPRLR